jgi:hypothetical protein
VRLKNESGILPVASPELRQDQEEKQDRTMLRLWFIYFVLLFGAAQFYQWLTHLTWFEPFSLSEISLPFPVLMMAGAVLAIASNADKQLGVLSQSEDQASETPPSQAESTEANPAPLPESSAQPISLSAHRRMASRISFTIDKTNHRDERRPSA